MKLMAISLAALSFAAPAVAQTSSAPEITIHASDAGEPSHAQAIECIALYWVAMNDTKDKRSEPGDTQAMMAWVNHVTSTEKITQAGITPEIRTKRDSLASAFQDPNDHQKHKPFRDRCAAFETRTQSADNG